MRREVYPPHELASGRPLHRGRAAGTAPNLGHERHDAPGLARCSSSSSNSNSRCYARVILAAAATAAATAEARGCSASMAGAVAFSGWLATARGASETTALEKSVSGGSIPIREKNGAGSERIRQRLPTSLR
ncbi:unnamed protein product, partial [Laminaria digitata]